MPIKRIGWVNVFVPVVFVSYIATAAIIYYFTNNRAVDTVAATIVAVLAIIKFEQVGKCGRVIAMTVILGLSVLILTGNAGASSKPTTTSRASIMPTTVAGFHIPI